MKVVRLATFLALIALLMIGVSTVLADEGTTQAVQPAPMTEYVGPGQAGTTLSAYVTATAYYVREYRWTIDKSVTPATWDLFKGDSGTSRYTISVTRSEPYDKAWIEGQVCVTNGGDRPTRDLTISVDLLYQTGGGPYQKLTSASVDVSAKPELGPGQSYCYPYRIDFTPVAGNPSYKVSANVTITNHSGRIDTPFGPSPDSDSFKLPSSPTIVNASIHVDDTNGGSWEFSDSGSVSYDKTFTCDADNGTHNNTATIRETDQSDSAVVTVNCYALEVTKTASTSFTRTYNWSIDKWADVSELTLSTGQIYTVNYSVEVNVSGYTDSDWAVSGTISITNPAPMAATINSVSDVVSPDITATVDCGVTFPYTLAAESTLSCTYSASLPDATNRTNTATATLQNYTYDYQNQATKSGSTDFSGTANVIFASAAMTEKDTCVEVYDGSDYLGEVCKGDAPKTFTYARDIGPYAACGEYDVINTAYFVINDLGRRGQDTWTIHVMVPCGGCTLTQGYWKTHSKYGPAPYDDTWAMIGEDTKFFLINQTYYQVMWTSPIGGNAYYILAHQYIAAKLNIYNGAWAPSSVTDAIAWAETFFNTYKPADKLSKTVRAEAIYYAGVLAKFNEGYIGPGHCSE
jgi:hypothetical protein